MANRNYRTIVSTTIDWAGVLTAIAETIGRPMRDWKRADVAGGEVSGAAAVAIEKKNCWGNHFSSNPMNFVEWGQWMRRHCCSRTMQPLAMNCVVRRLLLNWPTVVNQSPICYRFRSLRQHCSDCCHFRRSAEATNVMNLLARYSLAILLGWSYCADCCSMYSDLVAKEVKILLKNWKLVNDSSVRKEDKGEHTIWHW